MELVLIALLVIYTFFLKKLQKLIIKRFYFKEQTIQESAF